MKNKQYQNNDSEFFHNDKCINESQKRSKKKGVKKTLQDLRDSIESGNMEDLDGWEDRLDE